MTETFEPLLALQVLLDHGVRFVVIGGVAANVHGSPVVTADLDIAYDRTKDNLVRLAEALELLHARLRGVEDELPFKPDARTLEAGSNFTFSTDAGPLDCLGWIEGISSYAVLSERALRVDLAGGSVLVASVDDLIAMKTAAGRPKDKIGVMHLEEIRKMTQ